MTLRAHPVFLWIFLVVLAPAAAVVLVTTLMLFGVHPQTVFAPGRVIKSFLEACGLHVANRVAVASTVLLWWAFIAGLGLIWERRRRIA
jgi:hypothetical protein